MRDTTCFRQLPHETLAIAALLICPLYITGDITRVSSHFITNVHDGWSPSGSIRSVVILTASHTEECLVNTLLRISSLLLQIQVADPLGTA